MKIYYINLDQREDRRMQRKKLYPSSWSKERPANKIQNKRSFKN